MRINQMYLTMCLGLRMYFKTLSSLCSPLLQRFIVMVLVFAFQEGRWKSHGRVIIMWKFLFLIFKVENLLPSASCTLLEWNPLHFGFGFWRKKDYFLKISKEILLLQELQIRRMSLYFNLKSSLTLIHLPESNQLFITFKFEYFCGLLQVLANCFSLCTV